MRMRIFGFFIVRDRWQVWERETAGAETPACKVRVVLG
ncbi:hypothetical protein CES86_1795 [Brucella lupini]|uniref:Uncharacterized protein n=1 Tax=Brucella lupini TaxID=255457 RepID=A0A256GU84_9HYPH|nr:hypothetical protein CES86_1795 [Brucella lupini]